MYRRERRKLRTSALKSEESSSTIVTELIVTNALENHFCDSENSATEVDDNVSMKFNLRYIKQKETRSVRNI